MWEQTGKSCALRELLPSVLRDHPVFGVGAPHELVVIDLDFSKMPRDQVCLHCFC